MVRAGVGAGQGGVRPKASRAALGCQSRLAASGWPIAVPVAPLALAPLARSRRSRGSRLRRARWRGRPSAARLRWEHKIRGFGGRKDRGGGTIVRRQGLFVRGAWAAASRTARYHPRSPETYGGSVIVMVYGRGARGPGRGRGTGHGPPGAGARAAGRGARATGRLSRPASARSRSSSTRCTGRARARTCRAPRIRTACTRRTASSCRPRRRR